MTMTPAAMEDAIVDCVLRVNPTFDRAQIGPDTTFRDLGLTSLEVISVVFEIEERFGVTLVDAGLDRFQSVREAVTVLRGLPGARA